MLKKLLPYFCLILMLYSCGNAGIGRKLYRSRNYIKVKNVETVAAKKRGIRIFEKPVDQDRGILLVQEVAKDNRNVNDTTGKPDKKHTLFLAWRLKPIVRSQAENVPVPGKHTPLRQVHKPASDKNISSLLSFSLALSGLLMLVMSVSAVNMMSFMIITYLLAPMSIICSLIGTGNTRAGAKEGHGLAKAGMMLGLILLLYGLSVLGYIGAK